MKKSGENILNCTKIFLSKDICGIGTNIILGLSIF